MNWKISTVLAAVLLVLLPASPGFSQNRVRAEGSAAIHKNFKDIARDRAIENAQRNAVEQAVGVMISSRTEVENYAVKLDRILAEAEGFINTYSIVSETNDGKTYTVVIDADVGAGRLQERMKAIRLIVARKAKPRLMIVFSGREAKDVLAESVMSRYFMEQGFRLVDAETAKRNRAVEEMDKTGGDRRKLSRMARGLGAEVLVAGRVEAATSAFTISNIEMHSNKVTVSAKVINGDTGEIIATDSAAASKPGVKGDWKEITENATRSLSRALFDGILNRWSADLAKASTFKLVLSGLRSYDDLVSFKERMAREVKGYRESHQRSFNRGQVDLDVELKGSIQGFADDLAALKFQSRKIKILEMTQNRIRAKLVP
ncbi:MAG: flagellar assembly protein T N-terminal domain-containing protein [Syntrophales bacterium]